LEYARAKTVSRTRSARSEAGAQTDAPPAVGAEQRAGTRLLLRGGVRAQTIDDARPSISGGVSVALTALLWADAQATGGGDRADRSWSIGLRARF
jgi:hypothetical protein